MVESVVPRAESQYHNLPLSVEGVVDVFLHSGPHDGFNDGFPLLVLETSLKLLSLFTLFYQRICPFISWDAAK